MQYNTLINKIYKGNTMKKYTLITGACGGLGKAFSVECAKSGHNLFLTDLYDTSLSVLAASLMSAYKIDVQYMACNLTDIDERKKLFAAIEGLDCELFMTINVAGLDYEGAICSLSSDMISTVIRLNTEATLDITRFAASGRHSDDFYIINVASMAGYYAMPLKAMYAASKRAIIQFSLAIREEIKERGGHVTALCPSGLRTMPKVIASIDSQGFMGRITTIDTGKVAHNTIKRALKGKPSYVPGAVNIIIVAFSKLVPDMLKAKLIYKRWSATRKKAEGGL